MPRAPKKKRGWLCCPDDSDTENDQSNRRTKTSTTFLPGDDIFAKVLIDETKSESKKNYQGELDKAGLRTGLGTSYFADQPTIVEYTGKWKAGQKHGLGKLNYESGYLWFDGEF
jgi:hypothetical protein